MHDEQKILTAEQALNLAKDMNGYAVPLLNKRGLLQGQLRGMKFANGRWGTYTNDLDNGTWTEPLMTVAQVLGPWLVVETLSKIGLDTVMSMNADRSLARGLVQRGEQTGSDPQPYRSKRTQLHEEWTPRINEWMRSKSVLVLDGAPNRRWSHQYQGGVNTLTGVVTGVIVRHWGYSQVVVQVTVASGFLPVGAKALVYLDRCHTITELPK